MTRFTRSAVVMGFVATLALSCEPGGGAPPEQKAAPAGARDPADPETKAALEHLAQHARAYGFDRRDNIAARGVVRVRPAGATTSHVRIQQTVDVTPVFGGEAIVHLDADGRVTKVTDHFLPRMMSAVPTALLSADEAAVRASEAGPCPACARATKPKVERWILRHGGRDRLTFRVTSPVLEAPGGPTKPVAFVDAGDGTIVWSYDDLQTGSGPSLYNGTVTLPTYHGASGAYYLQDLQRRMGTFDMQHGTSATVPFQDADDNWTDPNAQVGLDAQFGMVKTLDYYAATHARIGLDGHGGPFNLAGADNSTTVLTSRVHYSTGYNNAFWDGVAMTYGDGNGVSFGPFPTLDICGHELTHGVTQFSAGLIYVNESGALNEGTSDILGAMVERSVRGESALTWALGEEAYTPATPGDALRFMDDPHRAGNPDHYSERYTGTGDNGGVHTNSGIAEKAFYLAAHGGTHHLGGAIDLIDAPLSANERAIGADKAAAIWYLALTAYMTSTSNFASGADATVDAAEALYGAGSPEAKTMLKAWSICGVSPDRVSPTAQITAPADGASVQQTQRISVTATDNLGVKSVEFYIDGVLRSTALTAPFQWDWPTGPSGNGPHTIFAKAYDFNGNVGTSATVNVTVNNETTPPDVAITSPAAGAVVTSGQTVTVTATDPSGIDHVELWVDGQLRGTDGTAPYQIVWQPAIDGNGPHTLVAKATDGVNNVGTSAPVAVTVNLEATIPTVTILTPAAGASLYWVQSLMAQATDDSGFIFKVEFTLGGKLLGAATPLGSDRYSLQTDLGLFANGTYPLVAIATDGNGNVGASPPVSITIVNPDQSDFDLARGVPACTTVVARCDSGGLLLGRGPIGPEPHAPNTVDACPDGTAGQFHVDGSIDRLLAYTTDSKPFEAGKAVNFVAYYWSRSQTPGNAVSGFWSRADQPTLSWTALPGLGTLSTQPGAHGLGFSFTPKIPGLYVVRGAVETTDSQTSIACSHSADGERDDLVIAVGPDVTPPTVAITAPAAGAVVFGTSTVTATATDSVQVQTVELLVDGLVVATDTTAPYSFTWDTTTYANGAHQLDVRATDNSGNVATATRQITVLQDDHTPPTVAITDPKPQDALTGLVSVTGIVADDSGTVASVDLYRDGTTNHLGTATVQGGTWSFAWDTRTTGNGPLTLYARAVDQRGNAAVSAGVPVTVSNAGSTVAYDPTLKTPACLGATSTCDSLDLLDGRGASEPHAPNTLAPACADGPAGTYHVDASIDRVRVISTDGGALAPGKQARIEAVVWGSGSSSVTMSFFLSGNPRDAQPTWTLMSTGTTGGTGLSTKLFGPFVLPSTDVAAVRVALRPQSGSGIPPCGTGALDDQDDLVFSLFDATPPTATITQPVENAALKGTQSVNYTVSDFGSGMASATLRIDGQVVATVPFNGNYTYSWNTLAVADGPHVITLDATDRSGNTSSVTRHVYVSNNDTTPPAVALTAPTAGAVLRGTATVTATATDPSGVQKVEFLVDGAVVATVLTPPYSAALNTSTLSDGTHRLAARATDGLGLAATTADVTVTVDNNPPTVALTAPAAGAILRGSAVLTASASDPNGIQQVDFLVDGAIVGSSTAAPYGFSLDTGTLSDGTHRLAARATDGAGTVTTTADVTVTVDNNPPAVALTSPAEGSSMRSTVTIVATASDGAGVQKVEFLLDGVVFGTDVTAPYTAPLDTTAYSEGTHRLAARATDNTGNATTTADVTVTLDNTAPTIALTAPAGGAVLHGSVALAANASDAIGVQRVDFLVDGAVVGSATAAPYGFSLATGTLFDGTHHLAARATDGAGNTATTADVTVTVDNGAPTVTLTAPAPGALVRGAVTVSATAFDIVGLQRVDFLLDGAVFASATGAPLNTLATVLDTVPLAPGPHRLAARATDGAGNTTTTADVTITVDNTPPVVAVTGPAPGTIVHTEFGFRADASDANGIDHVDIFVDGTLINSIIFTPVLWPVDVSAMSSGSHLLTARATDKAGNVATSADVAINVDNSPPAVALTAPTAGALLRGVASLNATASDALSGVQVVEFLVDGAVYASAYALPYTVALDTATLTDGVHQVAARALDAFSTAATTSNVAMTIDNTPPATAVTAPAGGATVSGTVAVTATATDATAGIATVEFLLDGAVTSTSTNASGSYSWSWNTATATAGAHTLSTRATDRAGNQRTSASVSVTIAAPCTATNGTGTGLRGEYFDNADLTAWKVVRTDATINFDWGTAAPVSGIGADTFSVRWLGNVQARYTGTYTFTTTANDGVRVWVNGQQIINNWANRTTAADTTGTIALTGGQQVPIRVEYYDNTGAASAKLQWQSSCQAKQIVPATQLYPAKVGTGLKGEYFDNADFTGTRVTRTDATINFSWGTGAPISGIGADTFSVRWTGTIDVPSTETYTFFTTSDDGVRLWVNNQQLVNNWANHGAVENSGTIALTGGQTYAIKMEYFDNASNATAKLSFSTPTISKQVIPAIRLIPAP